MRKAVVVELQAERAKRVREAARRRAVAIERMMYVWLDLDAVIVRKATRCLLHGRFRLAAWWFSQRESEEAFALRAYSGSANGRG